jgi:hypothetical protein
MKTTANDDSYLISNFIDSKNILDDIEVLELGSNKEFEVASFYNSLDQIHQNKNEMFLNIDCI